jgi:hypothetical protein
VLSVVATIGAASAFASASVDLHLSSYQCCCWK